MAKNKQRLFAVTALAAAAALGLTGYSVYNKNKIIWQYLGQVGTPTIGNLPYSTATGEPTHAGYTTDLTSLPIPYLSTDLLKRIAIMLPESLNIAGNTRVTLSKDDQTNLVLAAGTDANIYVSFLTEGAGYRNSVGYFTYDPANPPKTPTDVKSELIFFPNTTQDGTTPPFKVAASTAASTVKLSVKAPQDKAIAVGFFVVADGWAGSRDLKLAGGANASGTTSTPGVDESYPGKRVFYSLKALNPEPNDARNLQQHTILLDDGEAFGRVPGTSNASQTKYQRLVLGFEDQQRTGGDHDFNDVLMAVHVTPSGSDNIINLKSIGKVVTDDKTKDSDGDGVPDQTDAYPEDPIAASFIDYPSSNGWGTLAYEDQWPKTDDYDLNDLVVRYRMRQVKHAQGKTSWVEMNFRLDASGAGLSNGFALALPGILPTDVYLDPAGTAPADLKTYLARMDAAGNVVEKKAVTPLAADTKQAVFEVFKDAYAKSLLQKQSDSSCKKLANTFANTTQGCPIVTAFPEFKLVVKMKTAGSVPSYASTNGFPGMPFDPFLFKSSTPSIEVHLPGKQPSARADKTLFNTGNDEYKKTHDASKLGTSYTYMTSTGLPWALNIPALWDYPAERVRVEAAYSNFVNWATSGGTNNKDWYVTPSDKTASTWGKTSSASKTFRNGR